MSLVPKACADIAVGFFELHILRPFLSPVLPVGPNPNPATESGERGKRPSWSGRSLAAARLVLYLESEIVLLLQPAKSKSSQQLHTIRLEQHAELVCTTAH